MIKYVFLLVALVLLDGSAARAQMGFGKPKDVAVVKSQPLIVLLEDEDPKQLKKLEKKPEELADYKAYVADYNAKMRELAPKLWHFSPSVEFRQKSELAALRKTKGKQFSVLHHLDFQLSHRHTIGGATPNSSLPSSSSTSFYSSEHVSAFMMDVVGNGDQQTVWRVQIAPGAIYTSDIIFSIKLIQQYLENRAANRPTADIRADIAKNGKQLRTKTLLLDEEDVKGKLTPADIKQVYPFPYQVVPRATIEQAVASSDARYACVRLFPVTESIMVQAVMNAEDGTMLGYSAPNTVRIMGVGGGQAIGKNNLKDFADCARGK